MSNVDYSDIELLKFVLKVLYEHDYDELAWRLLDRFGSVPDIFRAPYTVLLSEQGVTERVASFFSVARPIERQALLRSAQKVKLATEFDLVRYVAVYGMNESDPFDVCIYLNNRSNIVGTTKLVDADKFKQAVYSACGFNATRVVISRYIPYAELEPYAPSLVRLRSLINAIDLFDHIGVHVVDYYAYVPDRFFSLRRNLETNCNDVHVTEACREPYAKTSLLKPLIDRYNKLTDGNLTLPLLGD